jgi:hypothetical protein
MNAQSTQSKKPKITPVGITELVLVCVGVTLVILVFGMAARQKIREAPTIAVPIVGDWTSGEKPMRLAFQPDRTLVLTSTSPSQLHPEPGATETSAPVGGPGAPVTGTYVVQPGGKIAIKLNNGARYIAEWKATSPNRFDLIDVATEGVTTFDREKQK